MGYYGNVGNVGNVGNAGYYGSVGNYGCCYSGYGNEYSMGYCMDHGKGNSSTFVLIVILFILLIIVGATFMQKEDC